MSITMQAKLQLQLLWPVADKRKCKHEVRDVSQ